MRFGGLNGNGCRRSSLIGCAISARDIRMLQVRTKRDGTVSLHKAEGPIPDDIGAASRDAVVRSIRATWKAGKFTGRDLVVALPDEQMLYRRLKLAPMPDAEVAGAAHWQLARELDRPADAFVSACYAGSDGGGVSEGRPLLACAAAREHVAEWVGRLLDAGLLPRIIDVAPGAIARCLGSRPDAAAGDTLFVVSVGEQHVVLQVSEGDRPTLVRTMAGGRARLVQRVTAAIDGVQPEPPIRAALFDPSGVYPFDPVAREAMDEACRAFARELEQELRVCTQYLREQASLSRSPCGCVIGIGVWEARIATMLSEATAIRFTSPREQVAWSGDPRWAEDEPIDPWILPLGLACYEEPIAAWREAV